MKGFLQTLFVLALVVGGGYFGIRYFGGPSEQAEESAPPPAPPDLIQEITTLPEKIARPLEQKHLAHEIRTAIETHEAAIFGPLSQPLPPKVVATLAGLHQSLQAQDLASDPQAARANAALLVLAEAVQLRQQAEQKLARAKQEPPPAVGSQASPQAKKEAEERHLYFLEGIERDWQREATRLRQRLEGVMVGG